MLCWCVRTIAADGLTRYHEPAPTRRETKESFCNLYDLSWSEARRELRAMLVRVKLLVGTTSEKGRKT